MHNIIDTIVGVYGLPGSGKTTLMAAFATASLSGRWLFGVPPKDRVFSNVPIPGCYELTVDMIGTMFFWHGLESATVKPLARFINEQQRVR